MKNRRSTVLKDAIEGIALSCDITGNALLRRSNALLAPGGLLRDAHALAEDGQRCLAKVHRG